MSSPLPDPLDIVSSVEETLAQLKPGPGSAALVALARAYAAQIAYAEASHNSLKDLGPKLASTLAQLGAGRAVAGGSTPVPGSPEDEVARMRRRRAERRESG